MLTPSYIMELIIRFVSGIISLWAKLMGGTGTVTYKENRIFRGFREIKNPDEKKKVNETSEIIDGFFK